MVLLHSIESHSKYGSNIEPLQTDILLRLIDDEVILYFKGGVCSLLKVLTSVTVIFIKKPYLQYILNRMILYIGKQP